MWLMVTLGAPVCLYSVHYLPFARLDWLFVLLALVTVGIGSRIAVTIPSVGGRITVADTLIFLTMLLYGGEAAILLAVAETLCASLNVNRKLITILFNASMMACATCLTVFTMRFTFGPLVNLRHAPFTIVSILAVLVMALVQYAGNSGLVALAAALKTNQPFWSTWKKYYLWTSITYFVGASAAMIIARFSVTLGFYGIAATLPTALIVYLTYRTYLENIESSERHARQAELHVEELNRYIVEQERIREQFSQVEKLSALGQLSSGVAHDFNNCLAAILGRAELTLKRVEDPKVRRSLEIIIQSAEDGAKTVRRIQDFARQRRDRDFEPVSIDQILLDVSEVTRPRWKDSAEAANVHINLELRNQSNTYVMGDGSELREVLVNMVFNAVHAMPGGGSLTLSAEETGDDMVLISVADTGCGMPPEVRSRIFDPFYTTKGVEGMGLGLAVSYGIIRRHEGSIEVESEVGCGTTFQIKVPLAKLIIGEQKKDKSGDSARKFRRTNMMKILVVDDEERVRTLLSEILEDEGFEVMSASSGPEGLALFKANRFDGVFTDIGMPGMSGWELVRALRDLNTSTPIAVITGWGEGVSSDQRESSEVNWVLTKPFSLEQIEKIMLELSRLKKTDNGNGFMTLVA